MKKLPKKHIIRKYLSEDPGDTENLMLPIHSAVEVNINPLTLPDKNNADEDYEYLKLTPSKYGSQSRRMSRKQIQLEKVAAHKSMGTVFENYYNIVSPKNSENGLMTNKIFSGGINLNK